MVLEKIQETQEQKEEMVEVKNQIIRETIVKISQIMVHNLIHLKIDLILTIIIQIIITIIQTTTIIIILTIPTTTIPKIIIMRIIINKIINKWLKIEILLTYNDLAKYQSQDTN